MTLLDVTLALTALAVLLYLVELILKAKSRTISAAPARDALGDAEPEPQALRLFAGLMRSLGYAPQMVENHLVFPFPVRGAFNPGDADDVRGVVCTVNMTALTDGRVVTVVWLPAPVPVENRVAVMRAANELNATHMLGSWDLDEDTGRCMFRFWTFACDDEVPVFVPEAMFGQIENDIAADVICTAAYGPRGAATSP